jgi:K+-transporting ATPase ATPase C chain
MMQTLYRSFMATLVLVVICCGIYPLLVMGIGHVIFSDNASGGIVLRDGKPVGARLIGQPFSKPEYFHGRPSAAGSAPSAPNGYDATNSSASNLGPTNQKQFDAVKGNVDAFLKDNPSVKKGDIPVELVTASASGLDPHISPEGAFAQVERVAKARNLSVDQVRILVQEHVEQPRWGIFGESVVNVLALNLALDEKFAAKK